MTRLLLASPLLDEQRTFAETVQASGEMLLRVINDILDLSKIEAGKLSIDPCATDVATAVREVVKLFAGQSAEKQLRLEVEIDEDQPFWFVADAIRIKQVVGNLSGNAIKFTPVNGLITLRSRREGDSIVFSIKDSGPGIPEEKMSEIFERFAQLKSRNREGLGLGLYISKMLVEAQGGRVWVESVVGSGSTFKFSLPAVGQTPVV